MAEDINKINDEINKLRAELKRDPLKPFDNNDLERAKQTLSGIRAEIREMSSDLDYVAKSFKNSVNELSNQKSYLSDAKKSLNGIADIARKITDYRRGESSLNEKQLKDLQNQARVRFEELELIKQVGNLSQENQKELIKALAAQEDFNNSVEKTIEYQKQVNKEIGLLGTGIGGIGKALSKLGFGDLSQPLNDAIEKTKHARMQTILNKEEIKKINKLQELQNKGHRNLSFADKNLYDQLKLRYGTDKDANKQKIQDFKNINQELSTQTNKYKNIGNALKDQLTKTNLIDFALVEMVTTLINVDKQTGDLAKGFNITYNEALNLRDELYAMARDSGELTANTKAYQETILAVGKSLGSNAVLNSKDLETFTMLRDAAGLTNEELAEMQKLTYVSGINLEDNVGSLFGAAKMMGLNNKMLLNEKDIMRDVAKTSKAIQLSLGGQGKSLGEAAAQVKILGMNMKQVEDISSSLLNFEQSIASELEAELLTGKDLNLERARMYAINNDMEGVAREIRKNYGDTAEFAKMNRIQQEAAAKAVGMSREDLAATLTDEKALTGLSGEKRNAAQAALEFARARGMTEAEIGAKTIEDLRNQMSVQQELNKSVEKLKEVFVGIAQVVMPIVSAFASLVGIITQNKYALFALQTVLTGIVMKSIVTAIANIAGMSALAGPILGPALAIAGTTALMGSIAYGQTIGKNVGDMSYDNATGETFIATKEGGLFKPSSNDQIKVGPDVLFEPSSNNQINPNILKDNINKPIKSSSPASLVIDYNKMGAAVAISIAKEINNRPMQVSIEMDGEKVAKGVAEYPTESSNVMSTKVFQIQ
jgi:hypothetical protein